MSDKNYLPILVNMALGIVPGQEKNYHNVARMGGLREGRKVQLHSLIHRSSPGDHNTASKDGEKSA